MPVKTFLNCTMPALVNMSVGSFRGTSGLDGTCSWPFFRKKSMKVLRISLRLLITDFVSSKLGLLPEVQEARRCRAAKALPVLHTDIADFHYLASNQQRYKVSTRPLPNASHRNICAFCVFFASLVRQALPLSAAPANRR